MRRVSHGVVERLPSSHDYSSHGTRRPSNRPASVLSSASPSPLPTAEGIFETPAPPEIDLEAVQLYASMEQEQDDQEIMAKLACLLRISVHRLVNCTEIILACALTHNIDEGWIRVLAGFMHVYPKIQVFDICHASIDDRCLGVLSELVKTSNVLTQLRLRDNNVGDAGAAHLADIICGTRTVTSVDLSLNVIRSEGARALAVALSHQLQTQGVAITFLDLVRCCCALCSALASACCGVQCGCDRECKKTCDFDCGERDQ
jgi:hypothetical protein